MKRLIAPIAGAALLALTWISYTSCERTSFQTVYSSTSIAGNPLAPVSNELTFAICGLITRCNTQVTINQCLAGVSAAAGAGIPLGLPQSFSTLSSVTQGEQLGTLVGNSSASAGCYESINSMDCSNPVVQGAYSAAASNSFSGSVNLISSQSCGGILLPPTKYVCTDKVFLRGAANSALSPSVAGTGITYSISPPLPAGLTLDPKSGIISGAPTGVSPMTSYTVTATTSSGQFSTTTVNIRTADGFLVNDLSDSHNVGPGCLTAAGTCTLRAATEAIDGGASSNVILLPAGQINLTLGSELLLSKAADVYGDCAQNTTIDGQNKTRVVHVTGSPVSLQNLVVQNGIDSSAGGAGIYIDGSSGAVVATLANLIVQNNLYNGNTFGGGGLLTHGAPNPVTAAVSKVVFQNNSAGSAVGGGMDVEVGSQMTASDLILENNAATAGGGVMVAGTATISESLFSGNSAPTDAGGGVYCSTNGGTVSLVNDTITGNSATNGGGVSSGNNGMISIVNSTITNNTAQVRGGGLFDNLGPGNTPGSALIKISNSIVASNQAGGAVSNCYVPAAGLTSQGYNLSDTSDCSLTSTGDLQNKPTQLAPLQANGGFSETMAPLAGSPAIDAANPNSCPVLDQRGAARLTDGRCDIGAFETQ